MFILFLKSLQFWPLCSFNFPFYISMLLHSHLSTSLTFCILRCPKLISCIPCPSLIINHFFKRTDSFYMQIVLERNLSPQLIIVPRRSLLLGPLSWQSKEMYECILIFIYTYIYKISPVTSAYHFLNYLYLYFDICH